MEKIPDKVTREQIEDEMERTEGLRGPTKRAEHTSQAEQLEDEREVERDEGIVPEDRGSSAAPSDRPENRPPHPQDVIDIGDES